jgi:hypothetical protein
MMIAALIQSLPINHRYFRLVLIALMLMSPAAAFAGPREEANAVIDRWSAAYSSNDPEAVVKIIDLTRFFSAPRVPLCPRDRCDPRLFRAA